MDVHSHVPVASDVGKIILAFLVRATEGERRQFNERTASRRVTAKEQLECTGKRTWAGPAPL